MRKILAFTLFSLFITMNATANQLSHLPESVTNNAVTQVRVNNKDFVISFSGLGKSKSYKEVHNKTFVYNVKQNSWKHANEVPIEKPVNQLKGRLASIATSINDTAYIFGGYTVAQDHSEVSVPDVYAYHVIEDSFVQLSSMPIPVDDSVALTYQQRYIYLISGWHNDGNINLVQIYDTQKDVWHQASPFPGKPVFGHAAGIVENSLLVCDGVRVDVHENKKRSYASEAACYLGKINDKNPLKITWNIVPHPTGKSRYRMAALGNAKSKKFIFMGGSHNPYNYNGIGYNAQPSEPTDEVWIYDLTTQQWQIEKALQATMDHRGLILLDEVYMTVGGMGINQQVLDTITPIKLP